MKIYMKSEEEWEKHRADREVKEERIERRRRNRRMLKDFDCPEEEED